MVCDDKGQAIAVPCPHGIQPKRLRTHSFMIDGVAYALCEACYRRMLRESDENLKRARLLRNRPDPIGWA